MITSWRPLRRIFLRVFEQEGIPAAPAAEVLRCQLLPRATVCRPPSASMLHVYSLRMWLRAGMWHAESRCTCTGALSPLAAPSSWR